MDKRDPAELLSTCHRHWQRNTLPCKLSRVLLQQAVIVPLRPERNAAYELTSAFLPIKMAGDWLGQLRSQ